MNLRCKVGDLAVVVRTNNAPHLIGRIVRCVEACAFYGEPAWIIDPVVDGQWFACLDRNLRPIRDQPGTDETLTSKSVERETA